MLDMEKEYAKAKIKECNICHEPITLDDIKVNKIIMAITEKKSCAMVHKTCLLGR